MAMQAAEGTRDFLPDEAAFWLHRRRFARKLHQMAEEKKNAHHNRRAS